MNTRLMITRATRRITFLVAGLATVATGSLAALLAGQQTAADHVATTGSSTPAASTASSPSASPSGSSSSSSSSSQWDTGADTGSSSGSTADSRTRGS